MQAIEQKKVALLDMAHGALAEEVAHQFGKIADNLLDPNTDFKKIRKMTITLSFTTDEQREIHKLNTTTTVNLAPSKPISTQFVFGADENGEMVAVELTKANPGQLAFGGEPVPEPQIFTIGGGQRAAE